MPVYHFQFGLQFLSKLLLFVITPFTTESILECTELAFHVEYERLVSDQKDNETKVQQCSP